jgi:hypothetical protein
MNQANKQSVKNWVTREQIAQHFGFSVRSVANLQKRRVFVSAGFELARAPVLAAERGETLDGAGAAPLPGAEIRRF